MTNQMIHYGLYNIRGEFLNWLTSVYASNKHDKRKVIWKDISKVGAN